MANDAHSKGGVLLFGHEHDHGRLAGWAQVPGGIEEDHEFGLVGFALAARADGVQAAVQLRLVWLQRVAVVYLGQAIAHGLDFCLGVQGGWMRVVHGFRVCALARACARWRVTPSATPTCTHVFPARRNLIATSARTRAPSCWRLLWVSLPFMALFIRLFAVTCNRLLTLGH